MPYFKENFKKGTLNNVIAEQENIILSLSWFSYVFHILLCSKVMYKNNINKCPSCLLKFFKGMLYPSLFSDKLSIKLQKPNWNTALLINLKLNHVQLRIERMLRGCFPPSMMHEPAVKEFSRCHIWAVVNLVWSRTKWFPWQLLTDCTLI